MLLIGAGAAVLLLVGGAFFALTRKKKKQADAVRVTAALDAADKAESSVAEKPALPNREKPQIESKPAIPVLPDIALHVETLRDNVRQTVIRDPALAAGVIRSWIAQSEPR
jgi:flagellar biosynthesis/type III secretory pathway M-ring protein FliF/YscJ